MNAIVKQIENLHKMSQEGIKVNILRILESGGFLCDEVSNPRTGTDIFSVNEITNLCHQVVTSRK